MHELVKYLEIMPYSQSNLLFNNETISSCFFFFSLIINLYFLIIAIIAQIFYRIVELITPVVISTKEAKAEWKHI